MAFSDWSLVAANNGTMPGVIWSEGMLPREINNSARQMMADLAVLKGNGGAALIGTSGGVSVEAEFALHQTAITLITGTLTSGRLGYTTYALLAANITAAVGTLAEVPITDVGTHTDPVVGGVVNNTGIFKWSAAPAGWQRLYDTDAASGKPYATAAAASAAAALVSQNLCAGYAAGMAVALRDYSLHDYRRKGFIKASVASGFIPQTDGTLQVPAGVGCIWYVDNLPAMWAADRDAVTATNFSIDITSGVLDALCQIEQYNAPRQLGGMISSTVLDVTTDGRAKSITLAAGCQSLRIVVQSTAGAVIRPFGGASGYPSRPTDDAYFLAAEGAARALLDKAVPVPITDSTFNAVTGGLVYDYTNATITIPAISSSQMFFAAKGVFVDGDTGVFTFTCNLPLGQIMQGCATVYDPTGGHGPNGSLPTPAIIDYGSGVYAVPFTVLSPGGQAFYGISMTVNSPAGSATRVISDITMWKGIPIPPPMPRIPAIVQDYVVKQARYETDARAFACPPITCLGDSETQFSPDQKNWPQWLQTMVVDRADVHARGVPGDTAGDILLRGGYQNCTITGVAGGVIPATTTPVSISGWSMRPGSSFSIGTVSNRSNPDAYPLVYLNNVLGRIWCTAFDASNPPQPVAGTLFFQRLKAGAAVPVPATSKLIWQDGLVSQRHRTICMGTFNSSALTKPTADTMFARKLVLDGNYKNLLYIPYGVSLGFGATNPYYAAIAAAYPGQTLDINYAPTSGEQATITALFGIVFTSPTTILEMANGYVPSVLKQPSDSTHWNEAGHYLIALRIYAWVLANWLTP